MELNLKYPFRGDIIAVRVSTQVVKSGKIPLLHQFLVPILPIEALILAKLIRAED